MNRYYYVSVMNDSVICNGESLKNILKTADYELYEQCSREIDKKKIESSFKKKNLPLKVIIVCRGNHSYELATEEKVVIKSDDSLSLCEVSGCQVVDIFVDNPDYSDSVFNMMDKYHRMRVKLGGQSKIKK